MKVFETLESEVRSYCRSFPTVFAHGRGCELIDERGRHYLDFFAGAGALNYGHNDPTLRKALIAYLEEEGVTHSLDMATTAKRRFLERLRDIVLTPRGMRYVVQFPGPTGTNAVEAALKLARKVTGRHTVVSFTNAFHGMTLGSLSVTGNSFKRHGAGVPLNHSVVVPFDGFLGEDQDTLDYLEALLLDDGSGVDTPAAILLETIQAEGGVNVASKPWLERLQSIARAYDILLIVDDIQVGCGRTGPFFSFEHTGLEPDLICLSKSLSGYGLPLAVTLIRPELDVWEPGEHNGTFRGHNLAFVTASATLERWRTGDLSREVVAKGEHIRERLGELAAAHPELEASVRGRGLILGMQCRPGLAPRIARSAFERGLIIETAGPDSSVLKLMPPLVIDRAQLDAGLDIIADSVADLVSSGELATAPAQAASA